MNFENFGSSGNIKAFDKTPRGACTIKLPYANPEAAPLKPEAKNISIKTFICPKPDENDAGIIRLKIADLVKDQRILQLARKYAKILINSDPNLNQEANKNIKLELNKIISNKKIWNLIS